MVDRAYQIDEAARRWIARMDRGALMPAERAELDAWLDHDPRNRGAFLRAEAIWLLLDDGRSVDAEQADEPMRAGIGTTRRRLLTMSAGGLAAAAVGSVGLIGWASRRRGEIETGLGDIRRVALEDGSMAVVNTSSQVDIALRTSERLVTIEHGEAWFAVAKDRARPFVVRAGDISVRAVGTAFSVRRRGDRVDVQVTEGVVAAWTGADDGRAVRIDAGSRASIDATGGPAIPQQAPLEIDRSLAWRTGEIALDGETLAEAAAEFNRYNRRKILVDDPRLATAKLVGRFHTNEPDAFVRAAILTLRSEWRDAATAIRLSPPIA